MAPTSPLRASARRLLARDRLEALERSNSQLRQRVDELADRVARAEGTVAELDGVLRHTGDRLAGVEAGFDRLHATVVRADPETMGAVIEAIRTDVARLSADVNRRLAEHP